MAARRKKKTTTELEAQTDPRAALDRQALLQQAKALLPMLAADLLERAKASGAVTAALKARHAEEKAKQRTAEAFDSWQRNVAEQIAAAWFLSCVFVRTLEDRGLLERNRLAGSGARDSERAFFALAPSLNPRDYLLTVFRELCHLPAAEALFDPRHNPVWLLGPSAEATRQLLEFFRTPSAEAPSFRFGGEDTRFLGDLYQDLSENVRKRYALLQTPHFVESFILDRTLTPAIERFGLDDTTLIDPTCGSGHFLLGAFERLFNARLEAEPGLDVRQAAHRALDAVAGADINPYAVAIAKFRLTLAFLDKGGYAKLKDAPQLPLHVVVADSLLHNPQVGQQEFGDLAGQSIGDWKGSDFRLDDEAGARDVLYRTYAAVVGNPPYIAVKDAALRRRYAQFYPSCIMNYALTVPFCERFFQLGRARAYVGMITANSFMKREFGKKLVQDYLPSINLETIVNTSGAYIPGHGTPTVLMFGTAEAASAKGVRTLLANRGEPSTPADASRGKVWMSISGHWNENGYEDEYISVVETERGSLANHPWALGGSGANELKAILEERAEQRLSDVIDDIGFSIIIGEDEIYIRKKGFSERRGLPSIPLAIGEEARDWALEPSLEIVRPFDADSLVPTADAALLRHLWPWKTVLEQRIVSGSTSMKQSGRHWFDARRLSRDKHRWPLSITFAFVATHNHFVLDRGGKVFKQSAPIIKLPETATEDDHYALLAYLNSSTACFWMKQVMMNKGATSDHGVLQADPTKFRFEFDGTKLARVPLPQDWKHSRLSELGRSISEEAGKYSVETFREVIDSALRGDGVDATKQLDERAAELSRARARGMELQEELDELVYRLFDLANGNVDGRGLIESPEFKRRWERPLGKFDSTPVTPIVLRWQAAILARADLLERAVMQTTSIGTPRATVPEWLTTECAVRQRGVGVADLFSEQSVPYLPALGLTEPGLEKYRVWQRTWKLQRREEAGEDIGEIPVPPQYAQSDFRDASYWSLRGKLDVPKERFISYPGCESDEDGEPLYGWSGWDHYQRAKALAELYYRRKNDDGWPKERLQPMLAGLLELQFWLEQWHAEPLEELGGARPSEQFAQLLDAECAEHGFTHDDLRTWRPLARSRAAKKNAPPRRPRSADRTRGAES